MAVRRACLCVACTVHPTWCAQGGGRRSECRDDECTVMCAFEWRRSSHDAHCHFPVRARVRCALLRGRPSGPPWCGAPRSAPESERAPQPLASPATSGGRMRALAPRKSPLVPRPTAAGPARLEQACLKDAVTDPRRAFTLSDCNSSACARRNSLKAMSWSFATRMRSRSRSARSTASVVSSCATWTAAADLEIKHVRPHAR